MCLISVAPSGVEKTSKFFLDAITNGTKSNTDGSGFAIKYPNNIIYISKGFFTTEALITALKDKNPGIDTEVIVHSRIGTSGKVDDNNCHPFVVSKVQDTILTNKQFVTNSPVVAHNGVFGKFTDRQSDFSDTYHFIQKFLSIPQVLNILETDLELFNALFKDQFISYNKLALLFPNRALALVGEFTNDNGYFFSNEGYKNTSIRNVGGVETNIKYLSTAQHKPVKGFSNRVPLNDEEDIDTPFDGSFSNTSSDDNIVLDLLSAGKYKLTELNYQDFMLKGKANIMGIQSNGVYFINDIDTKEGTVKLVQHGINRLTLIVPTWIVENNCSFVLKAAANPKYKLFKEFLHLLDDRKVQLSKSLFKKLVKCAGRAKKDEVYIKSIGNVNIDALCIFLDQFRYLRDSASKRIRNSGVIPESIQQELIYD